MNDAMLTETPCPRCRELAEGRRIRAETVQPLPRGPWAPLARDGSGPCCFDCASADALLATMPSTPGFVAARVAVGNDRQEQYRLPGAPMGLVMMGLVRPSAPGDLERQCAWLDRHGWFGEGDEEG